MEGEDGDEGESVLMAFMGFSWILMLLMTDPCAARVPTRLAS